MKPVRILIAGGNAAGATAAAELKRLLPAAEVILFEKSPFISTGTCEFPYVVSGELKTKEEVVFFNEHSFLEKKKVEVRCNTSLVSINRQAKTITVNSADGKIYTEQYSYLVLATGARAVPAADIPVDAENVFAVKHFTDLTLLDNYLKSNSVKTAVVIGSGYTGLEFADALKIRGIEVTILENKNVLFPQGGNHLSTRIEKVAVSKGIHYEKDVRKQSFRLTGNKITAVVTGSRVIETDIVISSTGIAPNSDVAQQAGIKTGKSGGIIVNNRMNTSDPNIFACGDCVELPGAFIKPTGYFPNAKLARKGGYIAAANIAGVRNFLPPVIGVTVFRFAGVYFASCGLSPEKAKTLGYSFEVLSAEQKSKTNVPGKNAQLSAEVVIQKPSGKILGASFSGLEEVAGLSDLFSVLIKNNRTIDDLTDAELSYTPTLNTVVHILQQITKNLKR